MTQSSDLRHQEVLVDLRLMDISPKELELALLELVHLQMQLQMKQTCVSLMPDVCIMIECQEEIVVSLITSTIHLI